MAETYKLIHDEIEDELSELSKMELGSDEYKATLDGVTKLIDREIEFKKIETNRLDSVERKEQEVKLKQMEINIDKKDRLIKNVLTGCSIGVPAVCGVWAFIKSIRFEEQGSITSEGGRASLRGLLTIFSKWGR